MISAIYRPINYLRFFLLSPTSMRRSVARKSRAEQGKTRPNQHTFWSEIIGKQQAKTAIGHDTKGLMAYTINRKYFYDQHI